MLHGISFRERVRAGIRVDFEESESQPVRLIAPCKPYKFLVRQMIITGKNKQSFCLTLIQLTGNLQGTQERNNSEGI